MSVRRVIGAGVGAAVIGAAGCQIVSGMHDELVVATDSPDGGGGGSEICEHASVPLPVPSADDAGVDQDFVVALRVLRMKTAADGSDLGLDLDRYCSCQGEERSCVPPLGQPEPLGCDKSMGRDNQTSAIFKLIELASKVEDLSERYSQFAESGNWTLLFHVTNYNGQPDDNKVRVAWYASEGTAVQPLWDGNDAWTLSTATFDTSGQPKYFDDNAYVSGGTLVLSAPEGEIPIAGGNTRIRITFTSGTISARITKDEVGRWVLRDGLVAARIPQAELFRMVQSFRDDGGTPFCTDNAFWGTTRDSFCRGLDIQSGPAIEPNKPCNAASFAVGFDADPAVLGPPKEPSPQLAWCEMGADPYEDFMTMGCPQG